MGTSPSCNKSMFEYMILTTYSVIDIIMSSCLYAKAPMHMYKMIEWIPPAIVPYLFFELKPRDFDGKW